MTVSKESQALVVGLVASGLIGGCEERKSAEPESSIVPAAAPQSSAPPRAANAPPILDPHSLAALVAQFQELGGTPTPEGIQASFASNDPRQLLAAIALVRASKDRSAYDRVESLQFHESPDIRLAAACYLAIMGDEIAADRLRLVVDVPYETILAYDPGAQRRLVEAVRASAQLGQEGYCYQLSYLLMNGAWSARGSAAAALGSFQNLSDPTLELAWLTALDVVAMGLTHEDQRIRDDVPAFAQGLLASAIRQDTITAKILDRFGSTQTRAREAGFGELVRQFETAIDHLESCDQVVSIDEPPGLVEDPRKLASTTALQIIEALYEGRIDEIKSVFDIEEGVFEGMGAEEWIAAMQLEFPPGLIFEASDKPWTNQQWVIHRPTPTYMDVEYSIDLLNRVSGNWEAVSMPIEVQWWGYGWHITALDRFVDYEIIADLPGEFGSTLALAPDLEEPLAPLLNLYKRMSGRKVEDFASNFHDQGVFRGQSKKDFVESFDKRFAAPDGTNPVIIPAEYLIQSQTEDSFEGQIQVVALVAQMSKPVRVNYAFRVVRQDGRWVLFAWQDIGQV